MSMNKYKTLSDFEKGKIVAYNDCGLSMRAIGKKMNRTHKTVSEFLKKFKETCKIERQTGSGRKRATTSREDRLLVRCAKKQRSMTSNELKEEFNVSVSTRTLQNRLHENGFFLFFQNKKVICERTKS